MDLRGEEESVFACPGAFWKVVFVCLHFLVDCLASEDISCYIEAMKFPVFALLQVIDAARSVFFWVSLPIFLARGGLAWTGVYQYNEEMDMGNYGEELHGYGKLWRGVAWIREAMERRLQANTRVYQHNKKMDFFCCSSHVLCE